MRKIWKSSAMLLGTAMVGMIALSGTNAAAGDVEVQITAEIATTLTETATTPLNFGEIDLSPVGDTFTIDASGLDTGATTAAEVTGNEGDTNSSLVTPASSSSGMITIASAFDITGVSLDIPAGPVTLTGAGEGEEVTVSDFTANSTVGPEPKTGGDDLYLHIGGKLTAPPGTPPDTYSGTVTVTVNYN